MLLFVLTLNTTKSNNLLWCGNFKSSTTLHKKEYKQWELY